MDEKVTAAVLTAVQKMKIQEFKKPKLDPIDFLMKVKYCGICASDIHIWEGHWNPRFPIILGHEFIGEVADVGSEALKWRGFEVGDQIAVEMIVPCHTCEYCRRGYYNLCICSDLYGEKLASVEIPISSSHTALWGGYAQYLYVPEKAIVHKFEKKVSWEEAALTEPLAVAIRAIRRGKIKADESVAIVGPGPIGLLAVVAAKSVKANPIILIGTRDYRLKVGALLGADYVINNSCLHDNISDVKKLTSGYGADVVLETAGTVRAQQQAIKMARKAGRVIYVGLTGGKRLTLNSDVDLLFREINLNTSYLSAHAYQGAIRIIEDGEFNLGEIITHIYPLRDIEIAFQTVIRRRDAVIKALLNPWP
ncbi:MAG: alcohol dehydrogenase catalytic domain-containing protein [Candidatus Bathyarchaeota archaeon]|nr:MAG: alcohol dehydrogenase catalytic domain-containing protein [Candidatus Bathyarchaeota archaeon]